MEEATPKPETTARHTAGPWAIHASDCRGEHPNHLVRFVGTADFDEDASVGQIVARLTDSPEIVANARLIAASPDLLAACEAAAPLLALAMFKAPDRKAASFFQTTLNVVQAAIAKAKGGGQ